MELELFEAPRALALKIEGALKSRGVRAPPFLMAAALQYLSAAYLYCAVKAMVERGDGEAADSLLRLFEAMRDLQLTVVRGELQARGRGRSSE